MPLHYHITLDSGTLHYPTIVTRYRNQSHVEFVRLVQFAYDVIWNRIVNNGINPGIYGGSPIVKWVETKAIFVDGTIIRQRVCKNDCIERLTDAELLPPGQKWPDDLRDIIYEL